MKYIKKIRTYMEIIECYGVGEMEIGYDKKMDDLAIILTDDYDYDVSIEVDVGFIIDLDKKGRLVAIEIIDCSKKINKPKTFVDEATIEVFVKKYEFSYKIIISFNDGEEEIVQRVLK